LIANDERGERVTSRQSLAAEGKMEHLSDRKLKCYERLAIFGSFILGAQESEAFLVLNDSIEDGDCEFSAILNTGVEGLEALNSRNSLNLREGRKSRDLAGISAGCLAKELLGSETHQGSVVLAAAVEVYESPSKERIVPVFSFNSDLMDLVYRVRNNLPPGTHEYEGARFRAVLEPTEETKAALVIEAASDLLPENPQDYYRI
jgi:hypothetical protein